MNINWSKPSLSRDFALFAALIVFALSLGSLWITYQTYLELSERTVHQLETEATRIDRAMIVEVDHSAYLVEALGRQIAHMDTHDLNGIALLLRSFDTTATQHHVFSWIDDSQNNVVSSNTGVHNKPVDVSDRDYVKKSISEPWKIQTGRPFFGRVSEKWVVPVALGLTDTTGKFLGTILISMDIGTIKHDLRNVVKDPGITFAIYSKNMLPLTAKEDDTAILSLAPYAEKLKTIDFVQHPSGIISRARLLDSRSPYVYYEVSADYPCIFLLGYDPLLTMASIHDLLVPRLLQIFLMGCFMLALLWIVRLRILKPVLGLSETTAGIIRGEGYVAPVGGGADEVVMLAKQIKKLGDYLKETNRISEEKESKNLMLRSVKDAAEQSNKIKIEFLTAMSHELRTPLNTIVGFSEIMKNQLYGPLENTQYWQYAQDIHEAAQHLQSLIDDVLALSNAEAGMMELQEKPVDIRYVLSKCLRLVADRAADQKMHIELKLPDIMPRLLIDEQRLKQIVINLLLNATTSGVEDTNIIVTAYIEKNKNGGESFCISFIDHSTARIPATKAAREKTKSRKIDLSNLGIPLTKALVAMHQASLEIESQPGKPTSTIVRFPQARIVY
jgi:signal transduction histidine kinase